jgi:hypothetical protein
MTSLTLQLESLKRERENISKTIDKVQREILFENKAIEDLEGEVVNLVDKLSDVLTYLRDKYNKRYKLDMGFLDGNSIKIKIIEPKGGKNGYARYLE